MRHMRTIDSVIMAQPSVAKRPASDSNSPGSARRKKARLNCYSIEDFSTADQYILRATAEILDIPLSRLLRAANSPDSLSDVSPSVFESPPEIDISHIDGLDCGPGLELPPPCLAMNSNLAQRRIHSRSLPGNEDLFNEILFQQFPEQGYPLLDPQVGLISGSLISEAPFTNAVFNSWSDEGSSSGRYLSQSDGNARNTTMPTSVASGTPPQPPLRTPKPLYESTHSNALPPPTQQNHLGVGRRIDVGETSGQQPSLSTPETKASRKKPSRGPFKDPEKRRETGDTRRRGACIRCSRMHVRVCLSFISDLSSQLLTLLVCRKPLESTRRLRQVL